MNLPEAAVGTGHLTRLRLRANTAVLRDYGIVLALFGMFIALSFLSNVFFTRENLLNVLDQWAPVAYMALGGTVVLVAGGFDLSIGSIYAASAVIAALVANATSPIVGAISGVGTGIALGLGNGFLVTVGRMNPFVATIGTSIVFGGLAAVITGGYLVTVEDHSFGLLAETAFFGAKPSVYLFLAATLFCAALLNCTSFGRYTRAIGANVETARLSGVPTEIVRAATYGISGLGGGLAAVLTVSQAMSANPNTTTGIQFDVWAAMLLGGNSLFGGIGAAWRTVVGVLLLALIQNGFDLLGVDPVFQQVATGCIFLAAVAIDAWTRVP
jgi:ribose transport system permease protein